MLHAAIALAIQLIVGKLTGNWWTVCLLASGFYLGREHAQAEYRWIERFGGGLRANLPWNGVLDPKVWNLHSITDWVLPILFTGTVAILA